MEKGAFPHTQLTACDEWKPGTRVSLRQRPPRLAEIPPASLLAAFGWGVAWTTAFTAAWCLLLLTIGWSLDKSYGVEGSANANAILGPVILVSGCVAASWTWLMVSGAISPRKIELDWQLDRLTVEDRGERKHFGLKDIQQLSLRPVRQSEQEHVEGDDEVIASRRTAPTSFRARLIANFFFGEVVLLESDQCEPEKSDALGRLLPFGRELSAALHVKLVEEKNSIPDPWNMAGLWWHPIRSLESVSHAWRGASPRSRLMARSAGVLMLGLCALQVFQSWRWCQVLTPVVAEGATVSQSRKAVVADQKVGRLTTVSFRGQEVDDVQLASFQPNFQACGPLRLDLSETSIGDEGLLACSGNKQLLALNLAHTGITNAGIVHLSGCEDLRELNLSNTAIEDDGMIDLAHLPKLAYLLLPGSRVSDEGIARLHSTRTLRRLVLSSSLISEDARQALGLAIPGLVVLRDAAD